MLNKPRIDLLAFPEVAASTLYGMFDVLASAGRDWAGLVEGKAGASVLEPKVVSLRGDGQMTIVNGIRILPDEVVNRIARLRAADTISWRPP